MKIQCQLIREQWESYKKGTSLNSQVINEMVNHLKTCSACREFAYQHSLHMLLKASYEGLSPEPSDNFLYNLEKKLNAAGRQNQWFTLSGILVQKGWKLVPVMTLLLVLLLGSFVYQYKNISTLATPIPIEEVILFENTVLNENHILYTITTEELTNEK